GVRALRDFPLEDIVPYIDWSPFFHTWELRGVYPKIFDDPHAGERARELFEDAQKLLGQIIKDRLLCANGVYGFWPANSVGDDLEVYQDKSCSLLLTLHTLRQQARKRDGQFNRALADFIAPKASGRLDYLGAFAVTAGIGLEELCRQFEREHDDYNSIMAKALADRLAEAFAELLHKRARENWGSGVNEELTFEDLIKERYRGIRPAPGYPSQPDHTEKGLIFNLLKVEQHAGITLTESFAMMPASSVSGLYFGNPEAVYFVLGKIGPDQVEDYARRKGMEIREMERWLAPNLSYL
ncbi:MAG: methionine synthase, partial [Acidobacteria bacterium]|nr:methionine synthase [Acidobacteriota bacterium]